MRLGTEGEMMNDLVSLMYVRHALARQRIYLMLVIVFAVLAYTAPNFTNAHNIMSIFKATSLYALVATGFTIVMICGQLDLSIGSVVTLGGLITIGMQSHVGWTAAILAAAAAGATIGAGNGLLVTKIKVNSFIATLGTMIIVQGLVLRLSGGRTLTVDTFVLGTFLERTVLWVLSPRIIATALIVIAFEILLQRTPWGRVIYMIGGNKSTAFHAGLPVDVYTVSAFVLSGLLAGLAGALFSITINSAPPTMGANSLMIVVAAVIIGGTSMAGGRGSAFKSMIALLVLSALFNGLSCLGAGYEVRQIASGIVLAGVIVLDAYVLALKNRTKGQRRELLKCMLLKDSSSYPDRSAPMSMYRKDHTLIIVCAIAVTGCVAIVAIFAMFFIATTRTSVPTAVTVGPRTQMPSSAVDVRQLKASDGQPLLLPAEPKQIPPRPGNPDSFPEDDVRHWYDMEYAGWNLQKTNLPQSPADGPRGKYVILLKMVDHPYNTAYSSGLQKVADAHGIKVKTMVANSDVNIQAQQTDQAINEKPDLVIMNPVDAQACTPLIKRLSDAGIPVIASNLLASSEALRYCLAWTGPDDWGQMRRLARTFAELMDYESGYCIVQHRPGGSPFFSRTYSFVTELKQIAPKMELLAKQTTDLEAEKTMQVVSDWITRFGPEFKGIVSADDSGAQIGINEAIRTAKREDIVRVSAGNSKVGMDFIQAGTLHAITYQSAESDGAIAMQLAAEWFSGKDIPEVRYLPIRIITKDNVNEYLPPQW
jgi:ribose/xylose/arabinose/galactoside ABC-type transport system permease subunit/ABC-type sugar transport system substrate-binding protein